MLEPFFCLDNISSEGRFTTRRISDFKIISSLDEISAPASIYDSIEKKILMPESF